ncbi:MAG: ATP-binding protein [Planctomycetota bacterium]|jgi:anti-sigma regulatory factor (Ser/Thr protein kinase)
MKLLQQDISVENTTESLEPVRRFVAEFLKDSPFNERDRGLLVLAIDETVTSNILYSEASGRNGSTTVSLELNDACLRVRVNDTGSDRFADSEEVFQENLKRARQYEMSIFLIQQIVDEIHYIYRKGFQNELELIRFIYPKSTSES